MIDSSDPHFKAIQEFYSGRTAERSKVPYVNHIQEGLVVLEAIQASMRAEQAFCLHPIVQSNENLTVALSASSVLLKHPVDLQAVMFAMEYRRVANAYSSHSAEKRVDDIRLSHLKDVNDMLIADKVQNRADFERFHEGTHPRSEHLSRYFRNWLQRLEVTEHRYQDLVEIMKNKSS